MRRLLALLPAAGLALSLLGCGGPDGSLPSPSGSPSPSAAPTQAPESARFSLGYDPAASLHPITGDSQVNRELTGLVYQCLFELDNAFAPQPVLARSAAPSEDGYSWTVTMQTGAVFSDGTPLTASHAAASLNAARASGPYAARLSGITAVTAGDDAALTIYLSAPNGNLPALLDVPVALEREDAPAPLGSGPYRYERAGDRLYLQTNPYHAGAAALPYATIPLTEVRSAEERVAAFDSGSITAVTTEFTSPYALGYSGNCEASGYPTADLLYVGFRASDGPCQDAAVRRAFARAIDREDLALTELSGQADPACLPVSPLCNDYDKACAQNLDYDMDQAVSLLAGAGYALNEEDGLLYLRKTPLAVTLLVNSDNESRQAVADAVAASLGKLGVSVTVNTLPWKDYTAALAAGQFDLYLAEVRLTGDFDPTPLLTGALNYGGYENPDLAAALAAWRAATGADRARAARSLWGQFAQDVPFAPVSFKRGSLLVRWGMVSNLQPTRANPFAHLEEWTISSN